MYFALRASSVKARRAKYILKDLKLLEHFHFYISFLIRASKAGKDVMSSFESSSSYSNTFLVSEFTISQ